MHSPYFVKIERSEAENARQAIHATRLVLEHNNFGGQNGVWENGKCDYFDIGGGWSGELSGLFVTGNFHNDVRELIRSKDKEREGYHFVLRDDCKKYADEIQSMWLAHGGKNLNPFARDQYAPDGYDDDAIILTTENIDALKKKFGDGVKYYDNDYQEEKSISALSLGDVGDWLVVVDYHN